jgi:hypothetical protein
LPVVHVDGKVKFLSYVTNAEISHYLPGPDELSKKLFASSPNCTWTIQSAVSDFLCYRFLATYDRIKGPPPCVVFHGTAQANMKSIIAHGLLVPGVESATGQKRISVVKKLLSAVFVSILNGSAVLLKRCCLSSNS